MLFFPSRGPRLLIAFAVLSSIVGCGTLTETGATMSEASARPDVLISSVQLFNGSTIHFNEECGRIIGPHPAWPDSNTVAGTTREGRSVQIPFDSVLSIRVGVWKSNYTLLGLGLFAICLVGFFFFAPV